MQYISTNNKCSDDVLLSESRRLQDEIFTHRSKSPLVFDFYYKIFRDNQEAMMNQTGTRLVSEAKEKQKKQTI